MGENDSRNEFCSNHQDCMVRISLMENQVEELKNDREQSKQAYNELKNEFHEMQINVTKSDEKILSLFEKIDEIKNSISSLATDVRTLTEKMTAPKEDLFKTTMINWGLDLLKYGVVGGAILYAVNQFVK